MFQKELLIDGKGHLLGRLASTIAKEILNGQKVTVVRCEGINISGSLFRNKLKYKEFQNKTTRTNPRRGPFHYTAPSMMLWRTVRGMLPHKTARGQAALQRLKVFDGVPAPYDKMKRMTIPQAVKSLRLRPERKFCVLGDLASQVGWKCKELIEKLSTKRHERGAKYYQNVKAEAKLRAEAKATLSKNAAFATEAGVLAKIAA
jgi:large subunit ribosomal protein L13Ae